MENIRIVVGDGSKIQFWSDQWAGLASLKLSYPRIYALAVKKVGTIAEFGEMINGSWVWNVALRRQLFGWEIEIWECFLETINSIKPGIMRQDCIRWKGNSTALYSVKSYYESCLNEACNKEEIWRYVWLNAAPPKVEAFAWRLIHGILPVKAEISKRWTNNQVSSKCPLCDEASESINHLFLHCKFVWIFWCKWFELWGVTFVVPRDVKSLVIWWATGDCIFKSKIIWQMALLSCFWSIWICRNKVVFKGSNADTNEIMHNCLFQLGRWCKSKWPRCISGVDEFNRCPQSLATTSNDSKAKQNVEWKKLSLNAFTLNVDGAVEGGFGRAGVGGILRDCHNRSLFLFSKAVGVLDVSTTELLAIREGLYNFKESIWAGKLPLIVETDSEVCVEWIRNLVRAPAIFKQMIKECQEIGSGFQWTICSIPRLANGTADRLAKRGISCTKAFLRKDEA